jgi:hypothetical protein
MSGTNAASAMMKSRQGGEWRTRATRLGVGTGAPFVLPMLR